MTNTESKHYRSRRKELANLMGPNGLAIIVTNRELTRTHDLKYPFRPNSNFFYLTGFDEPQAVALIETCENGAPKFSIFCREKDEKAEIWDGFRLGPQGAIDTLGADEAFTIDKLDRELLKRVIGKKTIFYQIGHNKRFDNRVTQLLGDAKKSGSTNVPQDLHNLSHFLHEMRLIKSAKEIKLLKKACTVSAEAHNRVMRFAKPNMREYEIAALLNYSFAQKGGQAGFDTIVGSGANGCILHYIENKAKIPPDCLVLCDAGAELNAYNGDITRTWPSSGTFLGEQKVIYELVLAAQHAALGKIKAGIACNEYHDEAVATLTQGLIDLGLVKVPFDQAIEEKTYSDFYMHRTGHWLGADVHDVGDYKVNDVWRVLEPNMVLTVEPGLYIRPDDRVDERWHNIGVRIEDNVLVTSSGFDNLTLNSPTDIEGIEELRRHAF